MKEFKSFSQNFPTHLLQSVSKLAVCKDRLSCELRVLYRNPIFENNVDITQSALYKMIRNDFYDVFPECLKLLSILVTTSASSCGCERSFSALKRIKSFSRSTMSDSRISFLAMLSIEKDFLVERKQLNSDEWYDQVIKHFCKISDRKLNFTFK